MNRELLIDSLVRQSMVMIARLATTGGVRTQLAHLADQVFVQLNEELRSHGLGKKVIADMFGITLRAYHAKARRLAEDSDRQRRSLWQAIALYIDDNQPITRADLIQRFCNDDEPMVASVLRDMVDSGLVYQTGGGPSVRYRLADEDELSPDSDAESTAAFVWQVVHAHGPMDDSSIREQLPRLSLDDIAVALQQLQADGRVEVSAGTDTLLYDSKQCIIPIGASRGMQAAVLDHFQTMANAICAKAQAGTHPTAWDDKIGGSTYHFDICEGHQLAGEVLDLFTELRRAASELRQRVDDYNAQHPLPEPGTVRVSFYAGQNVVADLPDDPE